MKPNWNETKQLDNLQHVQELKDQKHAIMIDKMRLQNKYDDLCQNYNGLTKKHVEAMKEQKRLNDAPTREKELQEALRVANNRIRKLDKKIISKDDQIRDIKRNYQ